MADTIKLSLEFPQSLVEGLGTDAATASAATKEAVERFRMGFKDIPAEEIEQAIVESRRAVRRQSL